MCEGSGIGTLHSPISLARAQTPKTILSCKFEIEDAVEKWNISPKYVFLDQDESIMITLMTDDFLFHDMFSLFD